MNYPLSEKYDTPEFMTKIMGPNPIKLCEELLSQANIPIGAKVCDLGSGQGVTSVFMAREYGYRVYACDNWSEPEDNRKFFESQGLTDEQITPVKVDALEGLPFEKEFFDAVVSIDAYHYFGRDEKFLDEKLLPYVKEGGYIYIAIPGMRWDCHDNLPTELLVSWSPEDLDYIHDDFYWRRIVCSSANSELVVVEPMESNTEVWNDWLRQDNEYAANDRRAMECGGGVYMNFLRIVLKKRTRPF